MSLSSWARLDAERVQRALDAGLGVKPGLGAEHLGAEQWLQRYGCAGLAAGQGGRDRCGLPGEEELIGAILQPAHSSAVAAHTAPGRIGPGGATRFGVADRHNVERACALGLAYG